MSNRFSDQGCGLLSNQISFFYRQTDTLTRSRFIPTDCLIYRPSGSWSAICNPASWASFYCLSRAVISPRRLSLFIFSIFFIYFRCCFVHSVCKRDLFTCRKNMKNQPIFTVYSEERKKRIKKLAVDFFLFPRDLLSCSPILFEFFIFFFSSLLLSWLSIQVSTRFTPSVACQRRYGNYSLARTLSCTYCFSVEKIKGYIQNRKKEKMYSQKVFSGMTKWRTIQKTQNLCEVHSKSAKTLLENSQMPDARLIWLTRRQYLIAHVPSRAVSAFCLLLKFSLKILFLFFFFRRLHTGSLIPPSSSSSSSWAD